MKTLKKIFKIIGLTALIGYSVTFITIFIMAYFNNYELVLTINEHSEANLELSIILLTIPFIIYFVFETFKKYNIQG